MSYEISLKMAWDELAALATESEYHVVFLSDRHLVRLSENQSSRSLPATLRMRFHLSLSFTT